VRTTEVLMLVLEQRMSPAATLDAPPRLFAVIGR
jgi:hypothetical protein